MDKTQLINEIENARHHLFSAAEQYPLCSEQVINLSSYLDRLLNQFEQFERARVN
ncbi:Spo0E like sporulation regulatory protein [Scopulibacillus darangshiensis]|uniref:Spo0E like sporulation regulatory protein n=1 Tax=Scopulibacillus darangshiensis TaxID=442528 RepID=A0A4R2P3U7_9BACL|nr:aspartyl-phosphate phosphatase Spo0E family protein [Scopulibacillus darangshiensis]TCP28808.1 Spo0E like sporulation regulatory protein [Scopulibacillus darangshiensis]